LHSQWHVDSPSDLRGPYDEVGVATLAMCEGCGLEYFSPLLPATGAFYDLLSSFYVEHRWEFDVVASRLGGEDSVPTSVPVEEPSCP
jgi:hypothetical protein